MNTLDFESRTWDPFTVLKPVGELDLDTLVDFERVVSDHLSRSSVVLDLSELAFVAISALRSLMVCHAEAEAGGRQLLLAGLPRQTRRLLMLSGLDGVLPVRSTVTDAVCTSTLLTAGESFGELSKLDVG